MRGREKREEWLAGMIDIVLCEREGECDGGRGKQGQGQGKLTELSLSEPCRIGADWRSFPSELYKTE